MLRILPVKIGKLSFALSQTVKTIELLPGEFIDAFGTMTRNVDTQFRHNVSCSGYCLGVGMFLTCVTIAYVLDLHRS